MTIFELSWGHNGGNTETRYFRPYEQCDAYVRMAERILEFDRDPAIYAAHVSLKRSDAEHCDVAWTKTSDERPTTEGALSLPLAA